MEIENEQSICGSELGIGIHRGKIIRRTDENLEPKLGVEAKLFDFSDSERAEIEPILKEFCELFGIPVEIISSKPFRVTKPISKRPFSGNYCGQLI